MLSHFLAVLDEMNTTLISVHDNWLFYVLDHFLAGTRNLLESLLVDWQMLCFCELLHLCTLDMLVISFEICTIRFFIGLEWIFLKD